MRSVIGVVVRSITAAAEISPPPSKSTAISSTVIIIERVIPIILVPSKAAKTSPLLRCAADSSLLDATHRIDKGHLNLPPVDFPAVQVLPRVFRVFQLPKLHATKLPPVAEGDVFDPAMLLLRVVLVELVRVENLPHVVSRQSRGDVRNVQNVRRVSAFTSYSRLRLFVVSRNFSMMMIAVVFRRRRLDDGRPTRVVQSHLLLYKLSLSMMISPTSVTTLTDFSRFLNRGGGGGGGGASAGDDDEC